MLHEHIIAIHLCWYDIFRLPNSEMSDQMHLQSLTLFVDSADTKKTVLNRPLLQEVR